jgi:hypothetical protein
MEIRDALGAVAVAIAIVAFIPYCRAVVRGTTKPHAFSWLVWGVLTAIGFAAQVAGHAGAGSWVTGFSALACFAIFAAALKVGVRTFPTIDWLCLIACGAALILWSLTSDALAAVILITAIDLLGFVPTFRKSYVAPHSETALTYSLSATKWVVSIAALASFSATTVLYPASLVVTNAAFVAMVVVRRRVMAARMK